MEFRVHVPNLFQEIVRGSGQDIYRLPIQMTGNLLAQVGERAAQLNDPILNRLMCMLTIYSLADPESSDYDAKRFTEITGQ